MSVLRIVANIAAASPADAHGFYGDILGLTLAMDHKWIRTYRAEALVAAQVSIAAEGGSGTPLPDLSIEVDDFDAVLGRVRAAGMSITYGPVVEPWGVRRFFVRDPLGRLVNILTHEAPAAVDKPA